MKWRLIRFVIQIGDTLKEGNVLFIWRQAYGKGPLR